MGRFLIADQRESSQRDKIREIALRDFVLPCIDRGEETCEIRAGDLEAAADLKSRTANVCGAISEPPFLEGAGVQLIGPRPADKPNALFQFQISESQDLSVTQAQKLLTMLLGDEVNSTSDTVWWELRDGRQIALQTNKEEPWIWVEITNGQPPFDFKHILHPRLVDRHDGLPARLAGLTNQKNEQAHNHPEPVASIRPTSRAELLALVDWYLGSRIGLDPQGLSELRTKFLAAFPDFEELTFSAREGGYFEEERRYKQALINRAADIVGEPGQTTEQLGGQLLDLITSKESGLLGWRTDGRIKAIRASHPNQLERAAGKLASSTADAAVALSEFVDAVWPLLDEGADSKPYSESRNLPSMLLALLRPNEALGINTTPLWRAGKKLLGRSIYGFNPLTQAEYEDVLRFGTELKDAMSAWGWQPRDLWDVQSFIWVVSQKGNFTLSNDEILAHFDINPSFKSLRTDWSDEETGAFCAIASAAHDAGLDWWFISTHPYQARFGRKAPGSTRAEAVQGYIYQFQGKPYLEINESSHCIALDADHGHLSDEKAQELADAIDSSSDEIAEWKAPIPSREGAWPDEGSTEEESKSESTVEARGPTNLILYGPPGTGKTYNTTARAIELIDGVTNLTFEQARDRYNVLREAGQIRFVTFHQSYSYEDFVEGLRPETGGSDNEDNETSAGFRLEPRDGIFREISKLAEQARKTSGKGGDFDLSGRQFFKMSLGRAGSEDHIYDAAIEGGYIVLGWGGEVDWSDPRYDEYQAIHDKWNEIEPGTSGNAGNISQVWRFRSSMNVGDIVIVSEGNSKFRAIGVVKSDYYFEPTDVRTYNHRRDVDWLVVLDEALPVETIYDGAFTMQSCYPLKTAKVKKEGVARLLPTDEPTYEGAPDQFVLIIDEINRANVSKVFGELITLLEPDKRLGAKNELKVKLPYSGDTFGVPSNLHVIGTMNTADRSIALLDTALRRRFRFEELMPRPHLLSANVDGINLQRLLQALNDRIEYLFDRDHQIGHAYFWDCSSRDDVDDIMRNKVIPLLTEYFYEDWERVRQALNETRDDGSFIRRTKLSSPSAESDQYASDRYRYEVKFPFSPEAYEQLA
ncbi:AAA family ATPase [Qipengyuania sp. 1NDW9]|uniref:AAA family ATPase n=1 Tax=Qipengyuania xiapuensis TaxID=2867236 RepID=UPI001C8686F7|nr:AAA family ATPase [Qipengyuania xiapuensis]MBX7492064.1 AAA family ATPase [Qipengyuania xiapuensis]